MKKIITLFTVFAFCYHANAQTVIPNASFETWNTFKSKMYPDKWDVDSFEVSAGAVLKVTPGSAGSSAIKLGCYSDGSTVYGAMIESNDTVTVVPGSLSFDYKMFNAPGFLNGLFIQLYFYDDVNFLRKFSFSAETNNSAYKTGVINIGFASGEVPTYYKLEVSYFTAGINLNEYTIVDNFRFGKTISSNLASNKTAPPVSIWPNPASNLLHLSNIDVSAVKNVRLISVDGKTTELHIQNSTIDISACSKGVYIIEITDNNDAIIRRERIIIRD